jgi:hypothetical protein
MKIGNTIEQKIKMEMFSIKNPIKNFSIHIKLYTWLIQQLDSVLLKTYNYNIIGEHNIIERQVISWQLYHSEWTML